MIVYVESNFILELAYLQEEHENCGRILKLAESGKIQLILPAFAIAEPFAAWVGRKRRRELLHSELTQELRELGRSEPYVGSREEFKDITKTLLVSGEEEKSRLDAAIGQILKESELIAIEADVIISAIEIQARNRLSPQDSIIYASVLSHVTEISKEEPKCFITKNSRDFADPDIVQELLEFGCDLGTNFGEGYGLILKHL
ncbi:MAG: PIN domain-containing protein [Acidobacteriota bacterium]